MAKVTTTKSRNRLSGGLHSFTTEFGKNRTLFLMLVPAVLFTVIFCYLPMGGIVIAFKNYRYSDGIWNSPWVGFNNFKFFFQSGDAWKVTRNTLLYNVAFIALGTVLKILLAVLIHEMCTKKFKKTLQSMMLLPYFLSWVVIGGLAYNMLNYEFGVINDVLAQFNLQPMDFYNTPGYWKYILVAVNLWQSTGYGMIFYLAAITGINPELYEAAYIDGAGLIQRIWHITLPLIMPTTVILVLLSLGAILKGNFQMFYQLVGNNGQLFDATDVIDTYVFRSLMKIKDYGLTTAAGLYQQVVGFVLVMVANYAVNKVSADSALF